MVTKKQINNEKVKGTNKMSDLPRAHKPVEGATPTRNLLQENLILMELRPYEGVYGETLAAYFLWPDEWMSGQRTVIDDTDHRFIASQTLKAQLILVQKGGLPAVIRIREVVSRTGNTYLALDDPEQTESDDVPA